jgi:hypothetical protein
MRVILRQRLSGSRTHKNELPLLRGSFLIGLEHGDSDGDGEHFAFGFQHRVIDRAGLNPSPELGFLQSDH